MKKLVVILFAASVFARVSPGQVMPAGVKVIQNGLKIDSVFLVLQGKPVQLNPFPIGSKLVLAISGIHGFSIRDNKTFPGCSMKVLDKNGKDVVDYGDLFQDSKDGVDREDA